MKKLKVLIVTPRYPPNIRGGGEISVKLLSEFLVHKGNKVRVISFDEGSSGRVGTVQVSRLSYAYKNVWGKLHSLLWLRRQLPSYDIVHAYNMEFYGLLGFITSFGRKTSIIATLNNYPRVRNPTRNPWKFVKREIYNTLLLYFYKRIRNFIAISDSLKEDYVARGFSGKDIQVIPNMYDPSIKVRHKIRSSENPLILYVGGIDEHKGLEVLLRALEIVRDENVGFKCRIVGGFGAPERLQALRKMRKKLGLQSQVEILSNVPYERISEMYEDADIFVHPAVWNEPFGRTVLEAMQFGLPTVVSDVGAPPSIIGDAGLAFKSGDSEFLATTLAKLIRNENLRMKLARRTKARLKLYSPDRVVDLILKHYQSIIKR